MNMEKLEKLRLVEWLDVHRHSRVLYLKLRREDCELYDIQPGDRLLVWITAIKRGVRPEREQPEESEEEENCHTGIG